MSKKSLMKQVLTLTRHYILFSILFDHKMLINLTNAANTTRCDVLCQNSFECKSGIKKKIYN
jgi:hypothetical protein